MVRITKQEINIDKPDRFLEPVSEIQQNPNKEIWSQKETSQKKETEMKARNEIKKLIAKNKILEAEKDPDSSESSRSVDPDEKGTEYNEVIEEST